MNEEETINWLQSYLEYPEMDNPGYIKQAIQSLINLYNKEKEKNKLTGNDIENFKAQAYMLGRKDENEAMKGVIERHYISKDKINSKIAEYEDILQSSIIKEDYKKEVEHIIRVLKELKGE